MTDMAIRPRWRASPALSRSYHAANSPCAPYFSNDDAIGSLRRAVANSPEFSNAVAWLAAVLALTGHEGEARDALNRCFLMRGSKTRTIDQWRSLAYSDNPVYLAFRERLFEGLRKAGMPEK